MHHDQCVCHDIRPIATRTRVVIVCHAKEARRASNSARWVPLGLTHAEILEFGALDRAARPLDECLPSGPGTALLFPDANAPVLTHVDPPVRTLVVPDGSWPQARRMRQRIVALRALPCVRLPQGPPSRFRLRSQTDPHHLSTFEAVARAVGILEGPDAQQHLDAFFEMAVCRVLRVRGQLAIAAPLGADRT